MPKKQTEPPVLVEPWRYSEKVSLLPGEKFRVTGGPFFDKNGKKCYMGERGAFVFVEAVENGIRGIPDRIGCNLPRFIYMGKEYVSADSGVHYQPHKLTKIRKKKKK